MHGLEHPLTGARYDLADDGTIRVAWKGQTGSFDSEGRWLCGELKVADPLLCVWLSSGPAIVSRHAPRSLPADQETSR